MSSSTTTFENFPAVTTTTTSTDCIDEGEFLTKPNTISHSHSQQQEFDAFSNNNTEVEHQQQRQIKTEILNVSSSAYETHFPSLSTSTASSFSKSSSIWVNRSTTILDLPASQQLQKKEFGNKTTTVAIVKRVKEKTNTNIDVSTGQKTGTTTFLIKGKIEDVTRAKFELLDNLAIKTTVDVRIEGNENGVETAKGELETFVKETIKVPISSLRHIIGSGGMTIQSIRNKSGVRIPNFPRKDAQIEQKTEIKAIIDTKASKRTHRITHIEQHYYQLIAGAHNQRLKQIATETGARIDIPFSHGSGGISTTSEINATTTDSNSQKHCITIIGDKDAVKKATEIIEEIYDELSSTTCLATIDIPKRQHKIFLSHKGAFLQEVFETTGCFVDVPSMSDPSEKISIRGPQEKFSDVFKLLYDKANSITIKSLDVTKIHKFNNNDGVDNPLEYIKNLYKYFINRNKLKIIESETEVYIAIPQAPSELDKDKILYFEGKVAANVEKAKKDVTELIKNLPPANFTTVNIESHLHRHIIGRKGQNLQRVKETYGVEIIVPDEKEESSNILIVYEGAVGVDGNAIAVDNNAMNDVLVKVKTELKKAGQDASEFSTKTLNIPVRFHRNIIGPRGATLNSITGGIDSPVSVKFGLHRTGAAERSANAEGKRFNNLPVSSDDLVVIKGPTEEVERVVREINKVVQAKNLEEPVNPHTINFTLPAKYLAHIIGKGGLHITRLKDGISNNVEQAKAKILSLVDKLQDPVIETLKIPMEYHKLLIGPKGRYVRKLEEKFIIRGKKKGIDEAKAELLELLDYEKENNNSITFTIPAKYLPHIVGRNGSRISEIRDNTSTRIDFEKQEIDNDSSNTDNSEKANIDSNNNSNINKNNVNNQQQQEQKLANVAIYGVKSNINKAKLQILGIVNELENQVIVKIKIDHQYHKYLIGPGGNHIREIVARAGGSDERNLASVVKFPYFGDNSDEVTLKGDKVLVESVKTELERLVEEQKNIPVDYIHIPPSQYSMIIGRNGIQLREFQERFNVEIKIPNYSTRKQQQNYHQYPVYDTNQTGSWSDEIECNDNNIEEAIKITGKAEDIKAAKNEILSRIRYAHTINIPRKFHNALLANGTTFKKLRNDFHVILDHDEFLEYEIIEIHNDNVTGGGDDSSSSKNNIDDSDYVAWKLRGEKGHVEKAEEYIKNLLNQEKQFTHIGYIQIPKEYHSHIIGRGGGTITRIRSESGCRIDVPKSKNDNDEVTLKGDKVLVESVKTELERLVEEQKNIPVDYIHIPPSQYSMIIGRNGIQLREFQERFNVEIKIPNYSTRKQQQNYHQYPVYDTNQTGSWSDEIECNDNNIEEAIKITGKAEDIKAAKNEILSRIRYAHTINIPRKFHNALLANGTTFKKLRNDFHVILDHDEFLEYEIIEIHNDNVTGGGDDSSSSKNNIDDSDYVAWKLRGEKGHVEKAEEYIKNLLNQEKQFTHIGYIQIPKEYHSHIIGRGGGTITRIRSESGCRIDVPKSKNDKVVVVTGSQEGVEIARQIMSDVIDRAENSNYY
ncbi:22896_t:CDS:10 [Entrophospora sp. SA101]|nr:22896_t:CDS:10 [Entrophospora sp. SA101]